MAFHLTAVLVTCLAWVLIAFHLTAVLVDFSCDVSIVASCNLSWVLTVSHLTVVLLYVLATQPATSLDLIWVKVTIIDLITVLFSFLCLVFVSFGSLECVCVLLLSQLPPFTLYLGGYIFLLPHICLTLVLFSLITPDQSILNSLLPENEKKPSTIGQTKVFAKCPVSSLG